MAAVEFSVPEPGVGLITLNRPERMNAITWDWVEDFHAILDKLADDRSVRAIVLTGAGRGFCSGFDLKAEHDFMRSEEPGALAEKLDAMEKLSAIPEKMLRARQPIIAAVNGAAMGAGFAIVLASDIRLASEAASFSVANARIGLSAGECGITWLFPRLVGLSRCFELLVTGRTFDAEEADRIGLLSRRTGAEALMDTAMDIARSIAANSGFAVRMSKDVIYAAMSAPDFRTASILENRTQMLCGSTGDVKEAINAFREKRSPRFSA